MSNRYAAGKRAIAECDVCGFRFKLKRLKVTMVRGRVTEIKSCPRCWDVDHPQLRLGSFPVNDPQAIRNPRPDFAGYPTSRAIIIPAPTLNMFVELGSVTLSY